MATSPCLIAAYTCAAPPRLALVVAGRPLVLDLSHLPADVEER